MRPQREDEHEVAISSAGDVRAVRESGARTTPFGNTDAHNDGTLWPLTQCLVEVPPTAVQCIAFTCATISRKQQQERCASWGQSQGRRAARTLLRFPAKVLDSGTVLLAGLHAR